MDRRRRSVPHHGEGAERRIDVAEADMTGRLGGGHAIADQCESGAQLLLIELWSAGVGLWQGFGRNPHTKAVKGLLGWRIERERAARPAAYIIASTSSLRTLSYRLIL